MSLFSEDKCFNCYHTDFYSRLSECSRSRLQHCTSFSCSLSLQPPPRIHKIDTQKNKTKKNVITELRLAPSL